MLNYNKVNEIFDKSKYSKRDIAKGCGFTRPTLDGLLRGADVKVSTLVAWARFFKKPVSYFFDEPAENIGSQGDHSGASVYGNVRISHTQGCAADGGHLKTEREGMLEEQIAFLRKHISALESQLRDKDELISLYKNAPRQ